MNDIKDRIKLDSNIYINSIGTDVDMNISIDDDLSLTVITTMGYDSHADAVEIETITITDEDENEVTVTQELEDAIVRIFSDNDTFDKCWMAQADAYAEQY